MQRDTPEHVLKIQQEIFLKKSVPERMAIMFDLIEFSRAQTREVVKRRFPGADELTIKIEMFKMIYENDFPPSEMEKIVTWFKNTPNT